MRAPDDKYNSERRQVRVKSHSHCPHAVQTALLTLPGINTVPNIVTVSVPKGIDLTLIEEAMFKGL